jgi:hypothetical protein
VEDRLKKGEKYMFRVTRTFHVERAAQEKEDGAFSYTYLVEPGEIELFQEEAHFNSLGEIIRRCEEAGWEPVSFTQTNLAEGEHLFAGFTTILERWETNGMNGTG